MLIATKVYIERLIYNYLYLVKQDGSQCKKDKHRRYKKNVSETSEILRKIALRGMSRTYRALLLLISVKF